MPRYDVIVALLMLVGLGILAKTAYIMFAERDFWLAVSKRSVVKNIPIRPVRGNIFERRKVAGIIASRVQYLHGLCLYRKRFCHKGKDAELARFNDNGKSRQHRRRAAKLFPEVSAQGF